MRATIHSLCTLILLLIGLTGCTGLETNRSSSIQDPLLDVPLRPDHQLRAIEAERNQEYLAAFEYWQAAETQIKQKISELSAQVKQISEEHACKGVEFYQAKQGAKALASFLLSLTYDPDNEIALQYLRSRYKPERLITYSIQENDSYRNIASEVYGSERYRFAVKHFSDAGAENELLPRTIITLPDLDTLYSQPLKDYRQDILTARKLFHQKHYHELLPIVRSILDNHPGDNEASYIMNYSLLKIANLQQSQEQYKDALYTLTLVDPSFTKLDDKIGELSKLRQGQLSKQRELRNNQLLIQGKTSLALGNYYQAFEQLRDVDPGFKDRESVLAQVNGRLKREAEVHFKKGISHFIQEDLTAAILEWEYTLKLDPHHLNASSSISKARELLEKVRELN